MVAAFEGAGGLGATLSDWLTAHLFDGRAMRILRGKGEIEFAETGVAPLGFV
jgi:hypothetical protein